MSAKVCGGLVFNYELQIVPIGFQAWFQKHYLSCDVASTRKSPDSKPAWIFLRLPFFYSCHTSSSHSGEKLPLMIIQTDSSCVLWLGGDEGCET